VPLTEITAKTVTLDNGAEYFAKLVLTGFESLASSGMVKGKLEGAGFTNVSVWDSPPAAVPDKAKAQSGKTFWVHGTWGKPTKTAALEQHMKRVWRDDAGPPAAEDASPPVAVNPSPATPATLEPDPQQWAASLHAATAETPTVTPNWGLIVLAAIVFDAYRSR